MRWSVFFFQAEDGIRDLIVTGVQTCALPISAAGGAAAARRRAPSRQRRGRARPARRARTGDARLLHLRARPDCRERRRLGGVTTGGARLVTPPMVAPPRPMVGLTSHGEPGGVPAGSALLRGCR